MKNQNFRKLLIVVLGLFLFSGVKVFSKSTSTKKAYWAIRNVSINNLGPIQKAIHHKKLTKAIVRLGLLEKKPNYNGGSKFSYQKFLNDLTDTVIPICHATEEANHCMFGGWVSVRSGRCNTPFSSNGVAAAAAAGTSQYNSEAYCNDQSLFRCNPLVFGPGIDQSLVDAQYGSNINGNSNNGEPYSAGICVDISNGFEGLSARCQEVSDHLDTLRETPWRESDFLNADRVDDFRALQGVIADRCEANRENINADGMCDSLENSLSLTATAARAGTINGINLQDIMPHCNPSNVAAVDNPACERSEDGTLTRLYSALEALKQGSCRFTQVQAVDLTTSMNRSYFPNECPLSISGNLRDGLGGDNDNIVLTLSGEEGSTSARITFEIEMTDTVDEILEKVRASEDYSAACNSSAATACNHPNANSPGAAVLTELNNLRSITVEHNGENVECNISGINLQIADEGDAQVTSGLDPEAAQRTSACPTHLTGEVQELIERDDFGGFGTEPTYNNVVTTLTLSKNGHSLNFPHTFGTEAGGSVDAALRANEEFVQFCVGESDLAADVMTTLADVNIRESFGLPNDQFLTDNLRTGLENLRGIEGIESRVTIDEYGQVSVNYEGLNEEDQLTLARAFTPPGIADDGNGVLRYESPSDRIDFLTNRTGVVLTETERAQFHVVLSQTRGQTDNGGIAGIGRDRDGNLIFSTLNERDSALDRLSSTALPEGAVITPVSADRSSPSSIRSYVIRAPAAVAVAATPVPGAGEIDITRASYPEEIALSIARNESTIQGRLSRLNIESFEISASEPILQSGTSTVRYEINIEGDSVQGRRQAIGQFIGGGFRASLPSNCSIYPRNMSELTSESAFSVVCTP